MLDGVVGKGFVIGFVFDLWLTLEVLAALAIV